MGTEITLDVGGISVDYSKNYRGNDHGSLFQVTDRKRARSEVIDYVFFAEQGEDPGNMEMAFVRKLRDVVPRLEHLGFTLTTAEADYTALLARRRSMASSGDQDDEGSTDDMSFAEFRAFVRAHAVQDLDETFVSGITEDAEAKVRGRFTEAVTARLPVDRYELRDAYSERTYFGALVGLFHPYTVLRILATVPANLDLDVVWQYGPLVEAGWAETEEFQPCARRRETFLIATEGSSDVHILRRAFQLLRPDIEDFFRFIDVSEGHPFSGTGSLRKFAEGLAKIDVHNQTVFLFDNDAEGVDAFKKLASLTLPPNMRMMLLPDLVAFESFPARGPEGILNANINGRAAAIECYLDLTVAGCPAPRVLWTNFKSDTDSYQGALEQKETFTKIFMQQSAKTIADGGYDTGKLVAVLDAIIAQCTAISERARCQTLPPEM
jgi:hypothetical protein